MGRRDRAIAATVALVLNGLIAWQLQVLLESERTGTGSETEPLQIVWIEAPPPRVPAAVAARPAESTRRTPTSSALPVEARARREEMSGPTSVDPAPTRPMAAVYLQQARQWAEQRTEATGPRDPFANRPVALAQQPASRFRLMQRSPADAVAKVGKLFAGDGYTTDDCSAIDGRLLGLVVGGDTAAVQQDLDYERRNCRR